MVRRTYYNGSQKTITGLVPQTILWTNAEVPGERVIAYHFALQGAAGANGLDDVDRIRISANGANIINITPLQLRSYWQSFTGGKIKYPAGSTAFSVPFCLLDAPTPDMQDVSQFPARSQVQIELVLNASAVAGVAVVSWTETSIAPVYFPRILASAMNIGVSVNLQRYSFQENGIVRGIHIPHTGIDRAKFALGNVEWTFLPGPRFTGLAAASIGNLLLEAESLYGNGAGSAGTPLTADAFSRITAGLPAPVDGSYIELQTQGDWPGVTAEACIYAIAPNGVQQAAA